MHKNLQSMPLADFSLSGRFWRDVATAARHGGHGNPSAEVDPQVIREAVEDMMRNYRLDEVPGFEHAKAAAGDQPVVPDTHNLAKHSAFAPVFQAPTAKWGAQAAAAPMPTPQSSSVRKCLNIARPIFVGPSCTLRKKKKTSTMPVLRQPEHFPAGGNPGVQADGDQLSRPEPVVHNVSPPWSQSLLPPWSPNQYVWAFPTGNLAWTPHPQPSPSTIPYPLSPWAAVSLTSGHPLPGTMPQWSPGTWPPLDDRHLHQWGDARARATVPIRLSPHVIPNPNNAHLSQIEWNVIKHPSTARRLTANHVVVELGGVWEHPVTDAGAQKVMMTCNVGHMSTLWGPVVIDNSKGEGQGRAVTVRDLFDAIYRYFCVPLTLAEVRYVCGLHPSNYHRLADAYRQRCRESDGLEGWEAQQGFRRADVLGDCKYWWGVWVSTREGVWWLNMGLVNPAHRKPSTSGV